MHRTLYVGNLNCMSWVIARVSFWYRFFRVTFQKQIVSKYSLPQEEEISTQIKTQISTYYRKNKCTVYI